MFFWCLAGNRKEQKISSTSAAGIKRSNTTIDGDDQESLPETIPGLPNMDNCFDDEEECADEGEMGEEEMEVEPDPPIETEPEPKPSKNRDAKEPATKPKATAAKGKAAPIIERPAARPVEEEKETEAETIPKPKAKAKAKEAPSKNTSTPAQGVEPKAKQKAQPAESKAKQKSQPAEPKAKEKSQDSKSRRGKEAKAPEEQEPDVAASLQRAHTQEIEEAEKKRKVYKARKERFYRSLKSGVLKLG